MHIHLYFSIELISNKSINYISENRNTRQILFFVYRMTTKSYKVKMGVANYATGNLMIDLFADKAVIQINKDQTISSKKYLNDGVVERRESKTGMPTNQNFVCRRRQE